MRVNKEFKNEVNQEFKEGGYIGKKIFVRCLILFIICGIIGSGWYGISKYYKTNIDRQIFKQSIAYNEGVLDDLAKYKLEMVKAEDAVERSAIAEMVVTRFANYDESKIENDDLVDFLKDCRNGKYVIKKDEVE